MLELLTIEEMYEADRLAITGGVPGIVLMENAGKQISLEIIARWPRAERVIVLCGPGNNGGDGFVIARLLLDHGYNVTLGLSGKVEQLSGDAAQMANLWSGPILKFEQCDFSAVDLVVDAIFGAGLTRPVEGQIAAMIGKINASNLPVIAVDLPTGINGDTGEALGSVVQADATVTFFRKKTGHVLIPGRDYCGHVSVVDIGTPETVLSQIKPNSFENCVDLWRAQCPKIDRMAHKYQRGHSIIVSGDKFSTGAARLGARAALRAGSGVVTIACPADAGSVIAAHETSVMIGIFRALGDFTELVADRRVNAVLLGPGNGVTLQTRSMVLAALASEAHLVLDADALSCFEDAPDALFESIKKREVGGVVLTPHEGEFSRLFKGFMGNIEDSDSSHNTPRLQRARCAAQVSGAVIVLKGPDTIIAHPDGRAAINANAPPWLATAGSGDVLAGMVTGLLAQGMPSFDAAAAAVWLHGDAGSRKGKGLIAEDLIDKLPEVLQNM